MLDQVEIENFKSIESLSIELGRINIFIGENGAGKSNILEAIALAGAAEAGKLDNEFLASRGVRVSSPRFMRSAFKAVKSNDSVIITCLWRDRSKARYELNNDNKPYSTWTSSISGSIMPKNPTSIEEAFANLVGNIKSKEERIRVLKDLQQQLDVLINEKASDPVEVERSGDKMEVSLSIRTNEKIHGSENLSNLAEFMIYSPENSALRTYEREGQIEPLGIYGEGLLRYLEVISADVDTQNFESIKSNLELIGWYKDLKINPKRAQNKISIVDKFMDRRLSGFDQRSANEGFLFLAFYVSLLTSPITPRFLAIDNVDMALNPRLCQELIKRIALMSEMHGKQVVLTTHNPACLDGLDLNDPEQRLFIVSRNQEGQTKVRRFEKKSSPGQPSRLSELFIRGALGGVPKGF